MEKWEDEFEKEFYYPDDEMKRLKSFIRALLAKEEDNDIVNLTPKGEAFAKNLEFIAKPQRSPRPQAEESKHEYVMGHNPDDMDYRCEYCGQKFTKPQTEEE